MPPSVAKKTLLDAWGDCSWLDEMVDWVKLGMLFSQSIVVFGF